MKITIDELSDILVDAEYHEKKTGTGYAYLRGIIIGLKTIIEEG